MKPCRTFRTAVLLVLSLLATCPTFAAGDDERVLLARDAARTGDRARLDRLVGELQGNLLESYVAYWQLQVDLPNADPAAVGAFLKRYDSQYLAEKLRSDWLKVLGKQQQWSAFDAEYAAVERPDQELQCYGLQSRRARGDQAVLDEAMPLWLNLVEPPEACYPILEALIIEKRVLADGVWSRVRRQIEVNKVLAARYSMNYLPASQTPDVKTATAVTDSPLPWLIKLPASFGSNRMTRELAALAIARVARSDPSMAAERLQRIESQLQADERGWAWGQVAWQAAQRHMSDALDWYKRAPASGLADDVMQWKVRAALRAQDWATVRATIEQMPAALAEQPAWTYWLGRADRATGSRDEATRLFTRIAGRPDFYGNLADEELGKTLALPPKAVAPTRDELAQAEANPGIQRALALFRLNLRTEATREWNWTTRSMVDRDLLAAAETAKRAGIYDRAIAAADRTRDEHDYTLRYLSPFSDQIRPAARNQSLDDAWVYGLMRQESRFVTGARSSVGASGLMQLMPATARWVARKIGMKDFNPSQVNDTDTNVLLGTSYMRMVMESLDNRPILASAAYNAGPGRARKWQDAERPLEGAVYAETIPFNETRDYVKKVMSNSLYYSVLFNGKSPSMKDWLGVVAPRSATNVKVEELP